MYSFYGRHKNTNLHILRIAIAKDIPVLRISKSQSLDLLAHYKLYPYRISFGLLIVVMKAIAVEKYGPVENLVVKEISDPPNPKGRDLLVR